MTDCWITDNEADYGAGIFDYDTDYIDSDLLLTTSAILRNEALEGAGLWSRYLSSITSVSSDWGEGTEDNTDHDLYFNEVEAYSYGDAASFACDTTACTE